MNQEVLNNNLNALKERAPEFYEKWRAYINNEEKSNMPKEDIIVTVETANNGSNILAVEKDGYFTCMNSTYNPEVEAYKYALQYENLQDTMVYLILGFGNGVAAREVVKHATDDMLIMFFEPSVEIFRKMLENFDIVDLIQDKRVVIFVKGINDYRIALYLDANVQRNNFEMVYLDFLPRYRKLYRDELEWCRHLIIERKRMVKLEINTIKRGRQHFLENPIYNLEYIVDAKAGDDFMNIFPKEVPAIMVAAGPSLSKNVSELRRAKGKAFIVAVDRVVPFLLDNDVEPDLIVTVDFHKELIFFENEHLKNIPYAVITDVNYRVLRKLDGGKFIYCASDSKLYQDLFVQNGHSIENLSTGGSVATFALGLLNRWGFDTIILSGQDLAWNDLQCHVGESARQSAYGKLIAVEGNVEDTVYTTEDFYSYIQYFNLYIEHACEGKRIINATEGGAKINGTQIMPLKEAINQYCSKEFSFKELYDNIPNIIVKENYNQFYKYLQKKNQSIHTLGLMIKEGKSISSRLITLTDRKDFGKEFKVLNQKLSHICDKFESDIISEFYNKSILDDEIDVMMDLFFAKENINDESIRLYKKLETAYTAMMNREEEIQEIYANMLTRLARKLEIN